MWDLVASEHHSEGVEKTIYQTDGFAHFLTKSADSLGILSNNVTWSSRVMKQSAENQRIFTLSS